MSVMNNSEQNQWANLIPKLEQFAAEADRQRGQGQGDDERPPDELVVVTELLRFVFHSFPFFPFSKFHHRPMGILYVM